MKLFGTHIFLTLQVGTDRFSSPSRVSRLFYETDIRNLPDKNSSVMNKFNYQLLHKQGYDFFFFFFCSEWVVSRGSKLPYERRTFLKLHRSLSPSDLCNDTYLPVPVTRPGPRFHLLGELRHGVTTTKNWIRYPLRTSSSWIFHRVGRHVDPNPRYVAPQDVVGPPRRTLQMSQLIAKIYFGFLLGWTVVLRWVLMWRGCYQSSWRAPLRSYALRESRNFADLLIISLMDYTVGFYLFIFFLYGAISNATCIYYKCGKKMTVLIPGR